MTREAFCPCCGCKTSLGCRMRQVRERLKLSQAEVAESIKIGSSTYSAYELDKKEPRAGALVEFCLAFDVSADWLLGLEQEAYR